MQGWLGNLKIKENRFKQFVKLSLLSSFQACFFLNLVPGTFSSKHILFTSGYLDVLDLEHIFMQPHYCLLFQPNPTHLLFAVAVWISISLVEPALGSRGEEKETENSILAFTTRQIGKSSRWNLSETSFQSNFYKAIWNSIFFLPIPVCENRSKEWMKVFNVCLHVIDEKWKKCFLKKIL